MLVEDVKVEWSKTGDQASILIVEDDEDTRKLLALILGNQGYRVTISEDGIKEIKMKRIYILLLIFILLRPGAVEAEIPTVLTDTIKGGDGIIDIFKDVSSADLQQYLSGGSVYLGVDLNESAAGLETSTTTGVAIKEIELVITTAGGDFRFSEFYTNTTAMILEEGAADRQLYPVRQCRQQPDNRLQQQFRSFQFR